MKERPAGITVIAGLYIFLGCLSLLWGFLALGVGGLTALFGNLFGAQSVTAFGQSSAWTGYVGILTAIVQIVVAIGLIGMKKWAWYLAIVALALTVILGVFGVFTGGVFAFICGSLGLIVPVIILIYLLTRGVRHEFGIGT